MSTSEVGELARKLPRHPHPNEPDEHENAGGDIGSLIGTWDEVTLALPFEKDEADKPPSLEEADAQTGDTEHDHAGNPNNARANTKQTLEGS
jgi:hypothetical protein